LLTFKKAETQDELNQIYKLRFKVYCLERGFESESDYPNQCELDEYDVYSTHFIAKNDNETVGTVRLILNNPLGFPIEKYCNLNISAINGIDRRQVAEISRFAISKEGINSICYDRHHVVLNLFREIYQESKNLGITYVCAAMSKSLQKLLRRCGIVFFQAGPIVEYHGSRAPYISGIKSLEASIFMKNSNLFRLLTSPMLS